MTAMQKKPQDPIAHLSAEDIENLGRELDAIRDQVLASRGERDDALCSLHRFQERRILPCRIGDWVIAQMHGVCEAQGWQSLGVPAGMVIAGRSPRDSRPWAFRVNINQNLSSLVILLTRESWIMRSLSQ